MKPLVSIIVPIYNVEAYLPKCIDSLISQTHAHIEIILVDDGSTDTSGHICDSYAQTDSRIKVTHKKNAGVSSARNTGIKLAKGSYICFVDGDDYVSKNFVGTLLSAALNSDADIAVCGLRRITPSGLIMHDECFTNEKMDTLNALRRLLISEDVKEIISVNKIYKRTLFPNTEAIFPVGRAYSEDALVMLKSYSRASRIVYLKDVLYFYVLRSSSVTNQGYSVTQLDSIAIADKMINDIKQLHPELTEAAYKFRLRFTLYLASLICQSSEADNHTLQSFSKWLRNNARVVLFNENVLYGAKVRALALMVSYHMYFAISKISSSITREKATS